MLAQAKQTEIGGEEILGDNVPGGDGASGASKGQRNAGNNSNSNAAHGSGFTAKKKREKRKQGLMNEGNNRLATGKNTRTHTHENQTKPRGKLKKKMRD